MEMGLFGTNVHNVTINQNLKAIWSNILREFIMELNILVINVIIRQQIEVN